MYLVPRTLPSRNLQLQLCFKAYRNHRLLFRLNGMDIDTFGFPKELNGNIAVFFKKKKKEIKKNGANTTLHDTLQGLSNICRTTNVSYTFQSTSVHCICLYCVKTKIHFAQTSLLFLLFSTLYTIYAKYILGTSTYSF